MIKNVFCLVKITIKNQVFFGLIVHTMRLFTARNKNGIKWCKEEINCQPLHIRFVLICEIINLHFSTLNLNLKLNYSSGRMEILQMMSSRFSQKHFLLRISYQLTCVSDFPFTNLSLKFILIQLSKSG